MWPAGECADENQNENDYENCRQHLCCSLLVAAALTKFSAPKVTLVLTSSAMTVNRDQLFAELNKLSADEIEAGLDAGVWSGDRRQLVEHYLDQLQVTTMQMEAAEAAKAAAQSAERQSSRATSLATAALIVAVGAMIAAVASAFVAFLGLQN
jgi:hypothetical protein